MSDITATNCGCERDCGCNNGCNGGCNNGCNGNGLFNFWAETETVAAFSGS